MRSCFASLANQPWRTGGPKPSTRHPWTSRPLAGSLSCMGATAEYLCYTDGSCKAGDEAPGGWGYHIRSPGGVVTEGRGGAVRTLAKVMEVRAVAEALRALPDGVRAVVYSDNQPLVLGFDKRLRDWSESGFVGVDPLLVDGVRGIVETIAEKRLTVRFAWVRGHNGNPGNERADELAAAAAREIKAGLPRRH